MPTISAGALKRMLGLPANVVAGVPRVEKDPRGGDVVIVPVRPYARDMDRCARCGERGRPYDRLGVRRWRHLDIGCARLLLEHAPRKVDCAEHGVTVAMVPWRDARARTRVFCQIFVGRFGVSFSPFERLFLGRFGFGQSCGLSVIA